MSTITLRSALDRLAAVASDAGVDPDQARTEGVQLAAAVSEPAVGAYVDWADQLGRESDAEAYFAAASRGRRWRVSPTPLMSQLGNTVPKHAQAYADALGQVANAACTLGRPNHQVAGMAATAAAAQLQAVHSSPSRGPVSLTTLDGVPGNSGTLDPGIESRLAESQERLRAMERFTQVGDQAFRSVLDQLQVNQQRIQDLRNSSLVNPAPDAGDPRGVPGVPQTPPAGSPTDAGQPAPVAAAGAEPVAEAAEAAPEDERSVEELLAELDALIGLQGVKSEIKRQAAVLRVQAMRRDAGLKVPTITRHLVFVGNPGTGKTTVARLVSGIYKALGLLSKGQLVEVDRSELVAGYLGQTALKTAEICKSAKGGVLFIDEAYSLSGDQYGEEAVNTLVKEMEDNRDDLVVIVAGYPAPMGTFIAENPGLASRFRTTIKFDDYTDDELVEIFELQVTNADYELAEGALDAFQFDLAQQRRDETFGNGRYCRNLLEAAIGHQAWRLRDETAPTVEQLRVLLPSDILGDQVVNPGDELLAPGPGAPAPGPVSGADEKPGPDAAEERTDFDIVTGEQDA